VTRNLLPIGSTSLFKCETADVLTQTFNLYLHKPTPIFLQAKRQISSYVDAPGTCLPNDVRLFLEELETHARDSGTRPDKMKCKQLLQKFQEDPDTCRILLQTLLDFEQKHPVCRGCVDDVSIQYVIQSYVTRDQVEQADELLTFCQSVQHFDPPPNCFGIVMNGYAKRKSPDALKRIEEMLTALENERLHAPALKTTPLDCYKYSILMNAYIGVLRKESVNLIMQTIERMQSISERLEDENLRPNLACYANLLKAYILRHNPGFALEVNAVLDELKADKYYLEQPAKDRKYLENIAIDAWSKSSDPNAPKRARQIFDAMDEPDSFSYNSICNTYATVGSIDKIFRLFQKMATDFESGKNKECRPNIRTYNIILNALQKSNRPDAAVKAEKIFNAVPIPDTITYNILINIYAQKGNVEKVLNLMQRMRTDFDSGKNKECCPNMHTYSTILNALQKSNQPDAAGKAEEIFNTIPLPDTVVCNTLISIYAKQGDVEKALNLVHQMQSDFESAKNKACGPNIHTQATVLNALQKSNSPDATETAVRIFNAIPSPNTVAYNTLLNIFAQQGVLNQALGLVERMQSSYHSGENKNCRPDALTYSTILNALQKSGLPDAAEMSFKIFKAIPSPDTITYTTLLNTYGRTGQGDKALDLFHRMQSDYKSGKNKRCRPNMQTYSTILNALHKSNQPDAADKAERIFNAILMPETPVYNTLLNLYASRGMAKEALSLVRRMQTHYDTKKNSLCKPDDITKATLYKALHAANDKTLKTQDVVAWFGFVK
jgi:pentatricopeptide repeat protein